MVSIRELNQHASEKAGSFSLYWALKDDSPIKDSR
jgi:hypothetical protein